MQERRRRPAQTESGQAMGQRAASLGERVRQARLARQPKKMTLAELAGDELSVAMVSRIERGLVRPSLETLLYLARRLGKPPSYLLGDASVTEEGAVPDAAAARALAEGRALLALGAVGDAAARFEAALHAADAPSRAAALVGRGLALLAGGRAPEGRESLAAGVRLAEEAGGLAAAPRAAGLLGLGYCAQREGQDAAALELFQQATAAAEEGEAALDVRPAALAAMAAIHRRRGDAETARSLNRQAARLLSETAAARRRSRAQLLAARRAAQGGHPGSAVLAAERAAELAALGAAAALAAQVALELGELALTHGGPAEARGWLQQALAACGSWGAAEGAPDVQEVVRRARGLLEQAKREG